MKTLRSFIICLAVGPILAFAQTLPNLLDYEGCSYVSGAQLQESYKNLIIEEKGFLTEVPLDFSNLKLGTTFIYSYFAEPFDPRKPTYVLFTGGPGQNSHLQMSIQFRFLSTLGYNFLLFDQRGVGFSRLGSESLARDARNYGSETTAKDLLAILNKLGIKKVAVYGNSYGTVPATIFASLFPERTTSVILEGVVYDGWNGVMSGRNLMRQIQKIFDVLPVELKTRLDQLIHSKKIDALWFPMTIRGLMAQYGMLQIEIFKKALYEALIVRKLNSEQSVEEVFDEFVSKQLLGRYSVTETQRMLKWYRLLRSSDRCRSLVDSDDLNHLLMLKEFDAGLQNVSASLALRNGKIVVVPGDNYASYLGQFTNMAFSSYSALQYPVTVPIFYLQGTADGATPAPGATYHFKYSARGPAQLLFFRRSGHTPFGITLSMMDRAEEKWQDLQKIFAQFLEGKPISCDVVNFLEKSYPVIDLAIATKGFPESPRCR